MRLFPDPEVVMNELGCPMIRLGSEEGGAERTDADVIASSLYVLHGCTPFWKIVVI